MKRYLLIPVLFFLFTSVAFAQIAWRPVSDRMVTVDATVGGVALAFNPDAIDRAIIVLETAQIRFCVTPGCAPTTTNGTPLDVGQGWILETLDEVKNFRAIRTGATSGTLSVIFLKSYRVTTQ